MEINNLALYVDEIMFTLESLFLNLLKFMGAISWPITVITFYIFFRKEIAAIILEIKNNIPRVKRAGPIGFDSSVQINSENGALFKLELNTEDIDKRNKTPAMINIEKRIIEIYTQDAKKSDKDKIHDLISFGAKVFLDGYFETTYRFIYGSQIKLLKLINTHGMFPEANIRIFFEKYSESHPEMKDINFEKWLDFIKSRNLIFNNQGFYQLSDLGQDFLIYITTNGLIEDKLF